MCHIVDDINDIPRVRIDVRHEPVVVVLHLNSMARRCKILEDFEKGIARLPYVSMTCLSSVT